MSITYTVPFHALLLVLILSFPTSSLTAQWNQIIDFPAGPTDAASSFVIGDIAYVTGGLNSRQLYSFHRTSKQWNNRGPMPGGSTRPWAFAFSYNGKGYVGGGALNGSSVTNEFYEYDPEANAWTSKAPFGGGQRDGTFSFVLGDKAYVGAGFDGQYIQYDTWEYSFTENTWTKIGDFPGGALLFTSSFVLNGKGYVVGGRGQTESVMLFEFDPATKGWTRKADFPGTPRQAGTSFAFQGLGYYGAGMAGYSRTFQDFWTYNPETDRWSKLTDDYPDEYSAWAVSFVVGDKAYVGTGANFVAQSLDLAGHFYSYPYEPPAPTVDVSVSAVAFGAVTIGASSNKGFTVSSATASELEVLEIVFDDPNAAAKGFSFSSNPTAPATLSGLGSLSVSVSFAPVVTDAVETTLSIRTNDPANPEVSVTITGEGTAAPLPAVEFSRPALPFGEVEVGDSEALVLTVSPANSAGLTVNSVAVVNPNHPQHGYSFTSNRALPVTLALGETLDITVSFEALDTGIFIADLSISTNAAAAPSATIPMSGRGFSTATSVTSTTLFARNLHATPNPAHGTVDLSLTLSRTHEVEINLLDMLGRRVISPTKRVMEAGEHHQQIDLSSLLSGTYFVEVLSNGEVWRTKIVKLP